MDVEFFVDSDPDQGDLDLLASWVRQETLARSGLEEDLDLAVLARCHGRLVGGCYGGTWGGTCELQGLWVLPSLRRQGLGSRLLSSAEAEAVRRGCHQVVLLTHQIQATPRFYQQRGYRLAGRVEDYPKGSDALWFRKRL